MIDKVYRFFISYRRDDNSDFVERIRDWLMIRYGRENVFMDYDSIPAFTEFQKYMLNAIEKADVFVLIIGPKWIEILRDKASKFEIDHVREEIITAIKSNKIIAPICIKGANPPLAEHIPLDIRPILARNMASLNSGLDFLNNIERIISNIEMELQSILDKKTTSQLKLERTDIFLTPTLFERLGIPVVLLEGSGSHEYRDTLDPQTIQYTWDPTNYILDNLPETIRDICIKIRDERQLFADKNDKPFYNGQLARVVDFQPLRNDFTGFKGMRLRLQSTDYHTFISTNHALESPILDLTSKQILFSAENKSARDLRKSLLANGLTVSVNIVIEQDNGINYLLVQKRNLAKVTHSHSRWQCSAAGSVNMPADKTTTYPNPFFSAVVREVKEETGIVVDTSQIAFLGLIRDTRYFEPALIAEVRVKGNADSILREIEDSFEVERFLVVPLISEKIIEFFDKLGNYELTLIKNNKGVKFSYRERVKALISAYAANAIGAVALTLIHELGDITEIERIFGLT